MKPNVSAYLYLTILVLLALGLFSYHQTNNFHCASAGGVLIKKANSIGFFLSSPVCVDASTLKEI